MRRLAMAMLGLAVSALALWLSFRNLTFREVWSAMRDARLGWLAAFAALGLGSWLPRAWQLRALARTRDDAPPSLAACWHAVGVAMLAQNVLPARIGEAARVVALARAGEVPPARAAGAVVLGRVIDLPALILCACAPCLLLPVGAVGPLRTVAWTGTIAGGALLGLMLLLARARSSERVLARVHPALGSIAAGFVDGLQAVRSAPRLAAAFAAACTAVLVVAASYACALHAFALDLPTGAAFAVVATVFLAVAIPAAPSSLGTYHAALIWLLPELGAPRATAAALAVATHALAVITYVSAGGVSLVLTSVDLRRTSDPE
jgi:uncharacterized membrane protein YbhN (UPF0104 family)